MDIKPELKLYNTYSKQIEVFKPLIPGHVSMYACGPTVYDATHIGHMRKYVMDDILKRTLTYLGYEVKHVMNITDVGHLTDDADTGIDKLEKGAEKAGQSVWDVATKYTNYFNQTMRELNVLPPTTEPKATDNVPLMVEMINNLYANGNAYITDKAIYFDVSTYPDYGKLSGQKIEDKKTAVRDDVVEDPEKRNPADFALWFFCVGRFKNHTMHWPSPIVGAESPERAKRVEGFPGWHIECSAMSTKYLGNQIDIHTGGIDHIPVHHENEIAQSMCAFDYGSNERFVKYWLHYDFLTVDGEKMSKSKNNFYTIDDVRQHAINPLALRLYFMGTHYSKSLNFTWEGALSAQTSLNRIYAKTAYLYGAAKGLNNNQEINEVGIILKDYNKKFKEALCDDLNTAKAMSVVFDLLGSRSGEQEFNHEANVYKTILSFDKVLGFGIEERIKEMQEESNSVNNIPENILKLVEDRQNAKEAKNYELADNLRQEIENSGYEIVDTENSPKVIKKF